MNSAFLLLRRELSRKLGTHGQFSGTMLLVIKKQLSPAVVLTMFSHEDFIFTCYRQENISHYCWASNHLLSSLEITTVISQR